MRSMTMYATDFESFYGHVIYDFAAAADTVASSAVCCRETVKFTTDVSDM